MINDFLSLAIFGSFIWFCIILACLIAVCFWAENVEHGGIALLGLVCFLIINHFWGNIPVSDYLSWTSVLIYLGLGFTYSVIRTYYYGRNSKDSDITYLKGNVFRWWLLFPISLLNWLATDLLVDLWNSLYAQLRGMFEYFFYLGRKAAKKEAEANKQVTQ